MSVYKRGGRWYVRFEQDGREVRRSAGRGASKADAQQLEKSLRTAAKRRRQAPEVVTFGAGLIRWLESDCPDSMKTHVRAIRPYLEDVELSQTVAAAADMREAMLKSGLSKLTINRRLACVKRVLNLAYREWNWLDQPIAARVSLFSERGSERHVYLSRDQVRALVNAATTQPLKDAILLAAYTGLRQSEILRLTPANWQPPLIVLNAKTKGKRPRSVPVPEQIQDVMGRLPLAIKPDTLRHSFARARKRAKLSGVRFHDLRHTYASWLAAAPDVPLAAVRDLLGHSSLGQTGRYSHLRTEALQRAVERLPMSDMPVNEIRIIESDVIDSYGVRRPQRSYYLLCQTESGGEIGRHLFPGYMGDNDLRGIDIESLMDKLKVIIVTDKLLDWEKAEKDWGPLLRRFKKQLRA